MLFQSSRLVVHCFSVSLDEPLLAVFGQAAAESSQDAPQQILLALEFEAFLRLRGRE